MKQTYKQKWDKDRAKAKDKQDARLHLRRMVREGKIVKPTICEKCNKKNKNIESHHEDYSKPEIVVWVCRKCHAKIHGGFNDNSQVKLSYEKAEYIRSSSKSTTELAKEFGVAYITIYDVRRGKTWKK